MNFLPKLVAVVLFSSLLHGVDARKCHLCDWQTKAQCVNQTTTCASSDTMCLVAKALVDGKEVYKKTCRTREDCNNVVKLCGRPDDKRTCLAGECCVGELCIPAQLRSIALPSSSVKTSSTSSSTQIIMTSSDVFATAAVGQSSSEEKTPVTEATTTSMAMATTTTTTTMAMATTTTSFKEIIAKATELGTPTTNIMISEALVHSKAPGIGPTRRPTCKDSSGMRHVLSPLAMVFVAARLVALLWMQF